MAKTKTPWDLRNIYLYLVCFVTVVMILFGAVSTLNSLIDLMYPEPSYYDSPDMMVNQYTEYQKMYKESGKGDLTFEEYQKIRDEQRAAEEKRQQAYRVKNIARNFSIFVVAIPFYFYHWKKIEKEKLEEKLE